MIPQRNISLLSNRLAGGGRWRIREDILERDYCLAWFLAALASFCRKSAEIGCGRGLQGGWEIEL